MLQLRKNIISRGIVRAFKQRIISQRIDTNLDVKTAEMVTEINKVFVCKMSENL